MEGGQTMIAEILMPVDVFIEVRDMLEKTDYMIASSDNLADIHEIYRKVYRKAAPYAVMEKDRAILYERARSSYGSG